MALHKFKPAPISVASREKDAFSEVVRLIEASRGRIAASQLCQH